ncbi:MAG: response regulator [Candidatus Methylacidiphilales bacterium]|nr:response regulator [Candidatus Methylacidiphilales bacterium]
MNICIIEDDPATRMLLRALVNSGQSVKHQVLECMSGEDALAKIAAQEGNPYDVYLVDLDLPGMSGLELIGHLRASYGTGSEYYPYIMMVTAHEPGQALAPALDSGANDYLTKPVNAKVLQTRLKVAQRMVDQANINAQSDYAKALLAYTAAQMNCPLAVLELNDAAVPLKITLANAALLVACPECEQLSLAGVMDWNDAFASEVFETLRTGRPFHGLLQCAHPRFAGAAHMVRAYPSGHAPCEHALVIIEPSD